MEPDEKQNPAPEGWKNVDPKLSYPVPTASQSFDGTNVTSYGAENQTTAPTTETTEPQTQPPFDPIEELYSLADELWGPKAGGMLLGQCKLHGVDLEHLTPETASKMIDALHVLVERLKQE
jgi:hypothetical protein